MRDVVVNSQRFAYDILMVNETVYNLCSMILADQLS